MPPPPVSLILYSAPLSGCTARVRIALLLKRIQIPTVFKRIDFQAQGQKSTQYLKQNPNASVPTLIASYSDDQEIRITQSLSMLDYLEHAFPSATKLLPDPDRPETRARVWDLASLVACDIQPPQNSRVREKLRQMNGVDGAAWARWVYERGFGAYEKFLEDSMKGRFSVGNKITMADVCLVPAVQGGLRVGLDLGKFQRIKGIVDECWELEEFRKGGVGESDSLRPQVSH